MLNTGRTTLYLDTARYSFAQALCFSSAAYTGNKAQLAADVHTRAWPEPRL